MNRDRIQRDLKGNKKVLILLVQGYIVVCLITLGLLYTSEPLGFQANTLIYSACVVLLGLVIWFFYSWYLLMDRLFDPYLLFLTSAILFNGGQALLEVFHLNKVFLDDTLPDEIILATIYLVILGLSALHFGAILSVLFAKPGSPVQTSQDLKPSNLHLQSTYLVGRNLLYISILPTLNMLRNAIGTVLSGGYVFLYDQQNQVVGLSSVADKMTDFIFPGVFFIIAGGQGKPRMRFLAVMAILLYSGAKFFLGTRGAAIMPLLAILWLWNDTVRPVPKALLLALASLMLFVVFPIVGLARNEVGADRFSIEFLLTSLASVDNPAVASIEEMGGSMKTVAWTLQLVPSVRPFALGMTYLTGFLVLIPNVFSQGRHPALTISGYDISDFWLVREIEPGFAERGGSFGFSFIAEAYLNFGWLGVPIVLGILGFLYAKLVVWAVRSGDPAKLAVLATFVSFFLFYARGGFEMVVRPFVLFSLLPYMWIKFLESSKLKKNFPRVFKGVLINECCCCS